MVLFLTGSPTRYEEPSFTEDNGFLADVRAALARASGGLPPKVLLVSAAPDDEGFTESVRKGMSECMHASGIETASITMLERRNAAQAPELVRQSHWIILCGGHVPTQNRFLHQIGLKALLKDFRGVVMGCSAGSMNCAETVYAAPEEDGEAVDPEYKRFLTGLGLTKTTILPHYNYWKDRTLDGLNYINEIILPDSMGRTFCYITDGSYILVKDGIEELRGEAYIVHNGKIKQLSANGDSVLL